GLCREEVVRTIIEEGPSRIQELIDLGIRFSEREIPGSPGTKELDLGREGGLLAAIARQPNIQILEDHFAVDLITSQKLGLSGPNRCLGVYVLDSNHSHVKTFACRNLLLATGGCGKVYLYTTNPDIATGDGVAMAYRAGASIANMEFIQFHPTALYHPKAKSFLITEAVRGEGGILRT